MMIAKLLGLFAVCSVCAVFGTQAARAEAGSPLTGEVKKIDGSAVDLSKYNGKVVLVVNVASRCGYTPQYAGLQKLYDSYKDKGLVVLGFPANEFGGQEPGSDTDIASFCSSKYGVTFDMFSKIVVKGPVRCRGISRSFSSAATARFWGVTSRPWHPTMRSSPVRSRPRWARRAEHRLRPHGSRWSARAARPPDR